MWYRTAIDLGKLFGREQTPNTPAQSPQKPDLPNDVFKEYVKQSIPRPTSEIWTGSGDQHLILTGTGDIHQGVSHSMFLDRILDEARKKINQNPELKEQYNIHRLPEHAYGPEDLLQRRNKTLGPNDTEYHPEDAVTEILHEYFDQGVRISNMAGTMTVNAAHLLSLMQIQKIFEIIHLVQPKITQFDIKSDNGRFKEVYDIDDVADFKNDFLDFKIHGPKKPSKMREWLRY
jgi:hypothetical protein